MSISEMLEAQKYLGILQERGSRGLSLERVYRGLRTKDLFLLAYSNLFQGQTIDSTSMDEIDSVLDALSSGSFVWKSLKAKGGTRATLERRERLVQEAMRLILTSFYEPQFSSHSHGYRQGRGCHTALSDIRLKWKGTKWFIEGDLTDSFDHFDHKVLLEIIGRKVQDDRFLKLLRGLIMAGILEDWRFGDSFSGIPRGGILNPVLSNIYLNELDHYIDTELKPLWTRGEVRRINPEYSRLRNRRDAAKKANNLDLVEQLSKELGQLSYGDPDDPDYRRLNYVRYAGNFVLGFAGTKSEAEEIRTKILEFLKVRLKLEARMSVIHGITGRVRFLGYSIGSAKADSKKSNKRRSINYQPVLSVPDSVISEWSRRYQRDGKPFHRTELLNNSDFDIVLTYRDEFRGISNYYQLAYDVGRFNTVREIFRQSLVKTLATKHRRPVTWVYKNYTSRTVEGVKVIKVKVEREAGSPLTVSFGADIPRYRPGSILIDKPLRVFTNRTQVIDRLLAEKCELCGSKKDVEVHHLKALSDQKDNPEWKRRMAAMLRKTKAVCSSCHKLVHSGTYDGARIS